MKALSILSICMFVLISLNVATPTTAFAAENAGVAINGCAGIKGAGNRVAILIGNGNYNSSVFGKLKTPTNDAPDLARVLCRIGFTSIHYYLNASLRDMGAAIEQLQDLTRHADFVLFYYSGHGMAYGGTDYLIPTDFGNDPELARTLAVPLDTIRDSVRASNPNAIHLVLLDACRTRAGDKGSTGFGLEPVGDWADKTLIVYAAADGHSALSDDNKRNSYFTEAVLNELKDSRKVSLEDVVTVFRDVGAATEIATDQQQKPNLDLEALYQPYYFLPGPNGEGVQNTAVSALDAPLQHAVSMGDTAAPMPGYATSNARMGSGFSLEGFIFPASNVERLTAADLAGMSDDQLRYARNDIYARHGYKFRDAQLSDHYKKMNWYLPWGRIGDQEAIYAVLNEVERRNIDTIVRYEKRMKNGE